MPPDGHGGAGSFNSSRGAFNGVALIYSQSWDVFQCGPQCQPWRPIELAIEKVGPEVPLLFSSRDQILTARAVVSTGPPARTDLADTVDVLARLMLTKAAFSMGVAAGECAGVIASAYRMMEELGKVFRIQLRPGLGTKVGEAPKEIDVSFREMRPSEQGYLKDVSVDMFERGPNGNGRAGPFGRRPPGANGPD